MQLRLRIEKKNCKASTFQVAGVGKGRGGRGGVERRKVYLLGGIRDKGKDTEVHQVCSKMTKTMVVVC